MAIAFDNATSGFTVSSATHTISSFVTTGSDIVLTVGVLSTSNAISGVTFGGNAMTQVGTEITMGNGYKTSQWIYKVGSATTANIVATVGGSAGNVFVAAASYTGCDQSTQPDNSGQTYFSIVSTSDASSLTPTVDDCWVVCYAGDEGEAPAAGANTTLRVAQVVHGIFDNNAAINPAASTTITTTTSSSNRSSHHLLSLTPIAGGGAVDTINSLNLLGVQ
ncbi:hypothetical protein M0R04_10975 [Candidatus Dojkabacteria bacterium]|jgi:hypothetical protein|nr:hypothetical protein [Candidatus Dojkabacteria bacterium]